MGILKDSQLGWIFVLTSSITILIFMLCSILLTCRKYGKYTNERACEKTKVFSCVLLLIDTTVVIFYKKVYTPPFPIRMLLWNPMRQLRLFSVYCDIYKDCVQ